MLCLASKLCCSALYTGRRKGTAASKRKSAAIGRRSSSSTFSSSADSRRSDDDDETTYSLHTFIQSPQSLVKKEIPDSLFRMQLAPPPPPLEVVPIDGDSVDFSGGTDHYSIRSIPLDSAGGEKLTSGSIRTLYNLLDKIKQNDRVQQRYNSNSSNNKNRTSDFLAGENAEPPPTQNLSLVDDGLAATLRWTSGFDQKVQMFNIYGCCFEPETSSWGAWSCIARIPPSRQPRMDPPATNDYSITLTNLNESCSYRFAVCPILRNGQCGLLSQIIGIDRPY